MQRIEDYFKDKNITNECLIINDLSKLPFKLFGSTDGYICKSRAPKKGWKNMWHGIYTGLEKVDIKYDDIIVSFRYDYFNILWSDGIKEMHIIEFIKNNLNSKNIEFIKDNCGCDNLYIGRYNKIKILIEKFHFNLDDILKAYPNINIQENLVYLVAKELND